MLTVLSVENCKMKLNWDIFICAPQAPITIWPTNTAKSVLLVELTKLYKFQLNTFECRF